jgi:hypothetical protein
VFYQRRAAADPMRGVCGCGGVPAGAHSNFSVAAGRALAQRLRRAPSKQILICGRNETPWAELPSRKRLSAFQDRKSGVVVIFGSGPVSTRAGETRDERVQRYIKHAAEARDMAARSMPLATKEDCLTMAESWLAMALDCEIRAGSGTDPRQDGPRRDGQRGGQSDART